MTGQIQLGAIFPQTEIGSDPSAVRDYAQGRRVPRLRLHPGVRPTCWARIPRAARLARRLQPRGRVHEPFVLFGYLAAATERIGLATGIIILPQRQTVLAAKQAAEVDVLSGGRLRLGIGIGWNEVEYEALRRGVRQTGGGAPRSRST